METLLSRKEFKIGEKIKNSCEKVQIMLVPVEQSSPLPSVGCALPSKEDSMEGGTGAIPDIYYLSPVIKVNINSDKSYC